MTLEELKQLKKRIDANIEELESRYLYVGLISEALGILIRRQANEMLIKIWLDSTDNLIFNIKKALMEIESRD